jgi:hypothetical protein
MAIETMKVTVNFQTANDPDGDNTRVRKEVDAWATLSTDQKAQVQAIHDALVTSLTSRYGSSIIFEGTRFTSVAS